ncbi:lipopolysaccharide biosynthesis protein [Runella slithyformis]|uniref:Lipopolysaccharide biosynthesis protein n=1 Tax=Runella slithyformis (strain ATCC 29530 / DSM 19594 / LMG 11500 / NCIMB 11436 / LSU 4) TaxID=761193 RepID=A0A7U3ZN78_RUNSL|nr:lipopolysaccharide biosynthesis protein [Runella slithyformis]AEI50311.1 lipopolysaccharide biosynthesis protein [Runella slithyformis DSM 19594]
MQSLPSNTNPSANEIEISFSDIFQFFRSNFRHMALWGTVFGILGTMYAFTAQKEFESKAVVLPEIASSGSLGKIGGLGALAGLAGIDISQMNSTEAIRPDLYPSITQSLPFALHLLQQKVYISSIQKTLTVEDYFNSLNKSWVDTFFNAKEKTAPKLDPHQYSQTVELNKIQEILVKEIQKRVVTGFDRKTGIITINTKMPDPVVAATVARLSVEYLKEYVTNYRTDKARKQLIFLQKQVNEAKARYQNSEAALAGYRDRNSFLVMNSAKISEQRLQSEFMLAQNVYNGLVQQYEQAKIKVQEETPIFKMLEPAKIPLKRSEPKRTITILIFTFLGCGASTLFNVIKNISKKMAN